MWNNNLVNSRVRDPSAKTVIENITVEVSTEKEADLITAVESRSDCESV